MMRWSRTSRHFLMSIVRMQSSNVTTPKVVPLKESNKPNEQHSIVAAAFASLKEIDETKSKNASFYIINNKIDNATSVDELLAISEAELISKQHALKVNKCLGKLIYCCSVDFNGFIYIFYLKAVSILAEWASSGKVKLFEFESNPKFLKLCRMLGKENSKVKDNLFSDLSTVLGITGDDEAAKLISSISLPQMVKVNNS